MLVKPVFSKVDYGLYRGVIVYFLKLIKNYIKKKVSEIQWSIRFPRCVML